jgi:hypothetical protein
MPRGFDNKEKTEDTGHLIEIAKTVFCKCCFVLSTIAIANPLFVSLV